MSRWPTASLGDVVDVRIGPFGSLLHKEDYTEDGVPLVNPMHIDAGSIVADRRHSVKEEKAAELAGYRMMPGDIVLGRRGEMGRCAVVQLAQSGFLCGTGSLFLRPDDRVSPEFLAKLMSSPDMVRRLERESLGTTMPNLNRTIVSNIQIELPPIEEQQRIAAILNHADSLRAKRREALARLDELTQSIFIEVFGDPNREQRWHSARFGDVCASRLGKMLDQKQQTGNHVRPYLRNANVQWFSIDTNNLLEMDFDEKARVEFRLEPGDILMCEGGEPGRAAIWREPEMECYYQKALHRIRPNRDLLTPEYVVRLFWFLSKGGGLDDHVTAATIAHLTGAKLKEMLIPLPPIDLQRQFVWRTDRLDAVAQDHRAALAGLDGLFASLQSRAFRGEL